MQIFRRFFLGQFLFCLVLGARVFLSFSFGYLSLFFGVGFSALGVLGRFLDSRELGQRLGQLGVREVVGDILGDRLFLRTVGVGLQMYVVFFSLLGSRFFRCLAYSGFEVFVRFEGYSSQFGVFIGVYVWKVESI